MLRLARMPTSRLHRARAFSTMLVDGVVQPAAVSVHDLTFIRGDGAFDVVSLLPAPSNHEVGLPTGLQMHLDRLEGTCRSLRLPLAPIQRVADWVRQVGRASGPGSCRIIVTRGQPAKEVPSKCLLLHDPPPAAAPPAGLRLLTMGAPWHVGYGLPLLDSPPAYGDKSEPDSWKTVKWTSYGANCLATRMAQERGADEPLLLASDGRVLDGPNFAVGFVIDGQLRLVNAATHRMLPSCTQMMVVHAARAAGLPISEGTVSVEEAQRASAGFAMSATRHVMPILSIDGRELSTQNAFLCDVQAAYWRYVDEELRAMDPAAEMQHAFAATGSL